MKSKSGFGQTVSSSLGTSVALSFRHLGANEADAMEKKRKSKLNPDEGFSSFENATFRKYGRLTAQIKPDMEVYTDNKEKAGEAFYATVGTVVHGVHKVSPQNIV